MIKPKLGFTLIEVLIALAILSIALTAIIHATSQNIRDNIYIQNKTGATWVATEVINKIRAGILKLSEDSELEDETEMLNKTWPWLATLKATPNSNIKNIAVTVFTPEEHTELVHLESYLYAPQA